MIEKLTMYIIINANETMYSNRIHERQEQLEKERKEKEDFRHPFRVVFLVENSDTIQQFAAFHLTKKFCDENNVVFSSREYNSYEYKEDRDNITKLPAFHIYSRIGKDHWSTFYPADNPTEKIKEQIQILKAEEEARIARREKWNKRVSSLICFFESFKRKPALQKDKSLSKQ